MHATTASVDAVVQAAGASHDVRVQTATGADACVPAAGTNAPGLVADDATSSAPGSDTHEQDAWGGGAARAHQAQVLAVVVQAAGASIDVVALAAWARVVGLVAAGTTSSAPGADAHEQGDALGGEAAQARWAQVVDVQGASAIRDVAVQAAGAGVGDAVQAAGASTDVVVPAAGPSVIGLVADKAACSAAVADAQNQHDIGGGEAAWPCRTQVLVVVVQAGTGLDVVVQAAGGADVAVQAGASVGVAVQAAGASADVAVQAAGASADVAVQAAGARVVMQATHDPR